MKYILLHSDSSLLEALFTVCLLGWSYILLIDVPRLFLTSPAYAPMAQIMPQIYWGAAWLVVGMATLVGMVFDARRVRIFASLGGTFLWSTIAATFFLTVSVPTGALVYGTFGLASALVFRRNIVRRPHEVRHE